MKTVRAHSSKVGQLTTQARRIANPAQHVHVDTRNEPKQGMVTNTADQKQDHKLALPRPITDKEKIDKWLRDTIEYPDELIDQTIDNHDNLFCCSRTMHEQRKTTDDHQPKTKREPELVKTRKPVKGHGRQVLTEEQEPDAMSDGESVITSISSVMGESARSTARSVRVKASVSDQGKHLKEVKSGFLDKPRSHVLVKHKWPHMNQNPRYITEALMFNQLNFPQFVGGECRTILRAENSSEVYGRLRILSKVAYLFDQCRSWEKARAAYFAIISSIEEGEASWDSSFGHYDLMCPAPSENKLENKPEYKNVPSRAKTQKTRDFFCKDYQKGDCQQSAPHRAWICNSMETVEHFCFTCFKAKLGKLTHVPGTEQCSNNR